MESILINLDIDMKDNGKTTSLMGKEKPYILMAQGIMANF